MKVLFPSDPLYPKQPDENFTGESAGAKLVGFKQYLFDHDEFVRTGKFKCNIPKNDGDVETIMLRGWMLKGWQYDNLYGELQKIGYNLINSPTEYLACHYYPNVYHHIMEYTAKSWWSGPWSRRDDADKPENISWGPVRDLLDRSDLIIKDYVKSEKGDPDLFILNKELSNEEFGKRIGRFIEARGKLFNHGIVLKKVEKLKLYENQTNEYRFFFINKKLLIFDHNSNNNDSKFKMPSFEIVNTLLSISKNIQSNFYTIDIAEKEDGAWLILETGDGQVSGLPNYDPIKFYNQLNNTLLSVEQT